MLGQVHEGAPLVLSFPAVTARAQGLLFLSRLSLEVARGLGFIVY